MNSKVTLFDFDTETWKSIKRNHQLLSSIAKERIHQELMKAFSEGNPFGLVALIDEAEMMPILFPALAQTKHYDQPIRYHPFDIYAHTILTLYHLQSLNSNALVRFAMLYHDVGKVGQYEHYGINLSREEIRKLLAGPLNHRFSSGELMEEDFKQLGFSKKEIDAIKRYIREHHTPGEILLSHPNNRAKKLKRLLSEAGYERVQNLLDINIADRLGMYNPLQNSSDLSDAYYLKELLDYIQATEGQFKKSDLAISGADIMEHFKLKPGKII
ncbi:MAG: HD domain-containing protein [bacterium]|nr:HD domain-containing protein [bacterium]